MKTSRETSAACRRSSDVEAPSAQSDEVIPAAIPAAEPVERGRFVLHLHNRDEDSVASENDDAVDDSDDDGSAPDSPKSFNSDAVFEDVEVDERREEQIISDQDLERLLGPLPSRRAGGGEDSGTTLRGSLEVDSRDSDASRRKRAKRVVCPCCPGAVRRGPWRLLAAMTGGGSEMPSTRVGNMIVVIPKCFHTTGFGIMGPHWFGPICCLGLLTIATIHFAPKAYRNIGPISAIMCLLFYTVGVVSLCIVSCSDPGVVKSGTGLDGRVGRDGYAGVPTANVSAGRGWRYCDLCSVYQPPDAVHCPECNVCVEGYDHHCPWMGTCIGKKNFASFMAFNLTWLFYLLYSIIWVTFVGASFSPGAVVHSSDSSGDVEVVVDYSGGD